MIAGTATCFAVVPRPEHPQPDRFQHRPQHELFDLTKDPFELENISHRPENAKLRKSLHTQLSDWRKKQDDDVPVYLDQENIAPN